MFERRKITAILAGLMSAAALLSGCELASVPQATPTPIEQVATPTETPEPSLTPSATLPAAILESPTATDTPGTPTETPTETPTPNPYATYIVQPGDTILYIIQQPPFFYRTDSVIREIMQLNPFISNINNLQAGSSITIPLPTATPMPEGFALTASAQPSGPVVEIPSNAEIIQVEVQEGQTIIGIAQNNSTTLPIIATLNPQIQFLNCDFSTPSGGPGCTVFLDKGDLVNVPALTPTPTLSPTISGSETPTPTPTFRAPQVIFPPQDASAPGRAFPLQWVSAGVLQPGEVYLIEIEDETAGRTHVDITTNTTYDLPEELVPTDGQVHDMRWRVSVAGQNAQGAYRHIGAVGDWRRFRWQSR